MSLHRPLLLAALLASTATLAEAPPAKVATCQACHGAAGISIAPDIPNLAGQKTTYLSRQLEAFKASTRKNDLMAAIASQLTTDDIKVLASYWSSLPAAPPDAAPAAPHAATVSAMNLPKDFPQAYVEYKREQDEANKTLTLRYANKPAIDAARAGKPLPEGSVLLTVNYTPQIAADGRWTPGAVKNYVGMETRAGWGDAIPPLLRNGNWNYGVWSADGTPRLALQQPRCLACHQPKATDSYVFTLAALKGATP